MLSLVLTVIFSSLVAYILYTQNKERILFIQTMKELSVLLKSDTVKTFAEYQEKDVEIKEEEEDEDFSSYVSISDASPEELRNATINLTPQQ